MGQASSPIRLALAKWPRERFDDFDSFASYWERVFQDYDAQGVADAIDAVRMHSDPYMPTCDAVLERLRDFGAKPSSSAAALKMTQTFRARVQAEADRAAASNQADDATIADAPPELVAHVADQVLTTLEPALADFYRAKGFLIRKAWRGLVAKALRGELVTSEGGAS